MSRKQILSSEQLNSQGFKVPNRAVIWDRYKSNPILLWNKATGEHHGLSVGRVENIRNEGRKWVGELVFDSTTEGQEAQLKWDEGSLNAVSIYGPATIIERDGNKYAKSFEVWEISLVNIPADPGATAIRDEKKGLSAVEYRAADQQYIIGLSAEDNSLIDKFENDMNNDKETKVEELSAEGTENLFQKLAGFIDKITVDKFLNRIGRTRKDVGLDAGEAEATTESAEETTGLSAETEETKESTETKELSAEEPSENKEVEAPEEKALSAESKDNDTTTEEKTTELSAETEKQENAGKSKEETANPTGLSTGPDARIYEPKQTIKLSGMSTLPYGKFIQDPANQYKVERVVGLAAAEKERGTKQVKDKLVTSEDRQAIREIATSVLKDKVALSAIKNMETTFDDGPTEKVVDRLQALASGTLANAYLEAPDLARIGYVDMVIRQLLPDDGWTQGIRRASVAERQGFIWVESAINPEIYYGNRAPVNAKSYMYDDNPRALSRKVLSVQPTVWQPQNTDILGYNDRALGLSEIGRLLNFSASQYTLQVMAESVAAANRVQSTGDSRSAVNRFPINPGATGTLLSPTIDDLLLLQGRFINYNLQDEAQYIRLLLSEFYYTSLRQDPQMQTILTRELSGDTFQQRGWNYSSYNIRSRSIIAAYDTAANAVVDAEKYFDKPVQDVTGAIIDNHVPPVLTPTTYDIGLAFIPSEFIIGVGRTHFHAVSDPNDYGWKVSVDMSMGAGPVRSNGLGLAMLVPTVG